MTKFNIDHTVNDTPAIYDLRTDLEELEFEIANKYHDFNRALNDYFSINQRYYSKTITSKEIELLKSFKDRHIKKIEEAFEKQNQLIRWLNNLNEDLEVEYDKS